MTRIRTFVNVSEVACATITYLKQTTVTSLKVVSLPRLELKGEVIGLSQQAHWEKLAIFVHGIAKNASMCGKEWLGSEIR